MTTPDPAPRRIDPAHILAVCSAASAGRARGNILLQDPDAARIFLPTKSATRAAHAALDQVGYQVSTDDSDARSRTLIVRGWDENRLEARLAAMRNVLSQLTQEPNSTAIAVIERFRDLPDELQAERPDRDVIRQGAQQLRAWIFARSGINAPHDPRCQPADATCARQLRLAWQLEAAIDDYALRHLRVAAHALNRYRVLEPVMSADQASDTAIRQASIMFHLSPPGEFRAPVSRPPTRPDARPRRRTSPSGPAGRHPR